MGGAAGGVRRVIGVGVGSGAPRQEFDAGGGAEPLGIEAELAGEVVVEHHDLGGRRFLRGPFDGHLRHGIGEIGGQADGLVGGGGRLVRL